MSTVYDNQVGYGEETTSGTYLAPTRTLEHVMSGLKLQIDRIKSKGNRAGRRHQGRWFPGGQKVTGPTRHELSPVNTGILFKNALGAVVTTGAGPYQHTFTPGPFVETKTMTVQVVKVDEGGVERVFSYLGCHIVGLKIASKVGEVATIEVEWYGQHLDTAQSKAAPVYASGWAPFTFLHGSATIAGSAYEFDSMDLEFANNLVTDRYAHRVTNPARPKVSKEGGDFRRWGGTINSDMFDLTAFNRFVNGTEAALVFTFSNGTHSLVITGNARFDGEDPGIEGPALTKLALPYEFVSTTSDAAAITAVLTNSDSTP